jgi:CubicO group peptidase (beta-lactamase class C family)
VLEGHPQRFQPGERFAYDNSGFLVLALIAERAVGMPLPDLARSRVCEPAGMPDTGFLRSDEPAERTALGRDGLRTDVLHLPVRGSGDGGACTTAADVHALWSAAFAGRIVPVDRLTEMVRPLSDAPSEGMRHGLGFPLHPTSGAVILDGSDAGVSFRSVHDEATGVTHTVLSDTTAGAWPVTGRLGELLTP